jgi:hypothetical protein
MKTIITTQNSLRAAAALLLAIFFAAGFTACSNEDNSVETFSPETVVGKWYFETEQHGTYGEGEDAFEFDKIVIYGNLRDDGTGTWYALFFNPYGNLIDTGDLFFAAGCQYSTTADGGVHMELNGQSSITGLMPSWDMTYKSGELRTADSDSNYRFRHITTAQDELVQACLRELGLGYGDNEHIVDLSELYSDYVAQDGDVLVGKLDHGPTIYIADGATITLSNCSILFEESMHDRYPALICKGSANIISSGNNALSGGHGGNPAIYVPQGSTLTISGYGTLDVKGCQVGAGIGSGDAKKYKNSGNIIIKSGRVNAYGNTQSAGIGSTQTGTCGDITIEGGEVYAYAGSYAAGIGSGYYGKCGNITIGNAHVESQGGYLGAGIGGGNYGNCKLITIKNGYVKATGGEGFPGIGVGTDWRCTCDGIKINGGEIYSWAGENGCIGMGAKMNSDGKCGPIIISNKIKSLDMKNPGASGKNLREVLFGESFEFGTTKQSLNLLLYLLESLEYDHEEVWQNVHYKIYDNGKAFTITPLEGAQM